MLILVVAAWTAGISLYLTIGILGLSAYYGWFVLPGDLQIKIDLA